MARFATLQDHKDSGGPLYACCEAIGCSHVATLDVDALIAKLGADFEVSAFTLPPLLRCSRCGGRKVSIRIPGAQLRGLGGRNA